MVKAMSRESSRRIGVLLHDERRKGSRYNAQALGAVPDWLSTWRWTALNVAENGVGVAE
jgi:hypothetical protein